MEGRATEALQQREAEKNYPRRMVGHLSTDLYRQASSMPRGLESVSKNKCGHTKKKKSIRRWGRFSPPKDVHFVLLMRGYSAILPKITQIHNEVLFHF